MNLSFPLGGFFPLSSYSYSNTSKQIQVGYRFWKIRFGMKIIIPNYFLKYNFFLIFLNFISII